MILATSVQKAPLWAGTGLGFNWFDVALVGLLAFGFWRGRRNGMSKELLPLIQWLIVVTACTLGYTLVGGFLDRSGVIRSVFGSSFNEGTAAYMTGYLLIAAVIFGIFFYLKSYFREKAEGSNTFGSGEYYLGMVSGMIRYLCVLIFFLALLNAPVYTMADINKDKAYKNEWYGGGLQGYSGDFIPSVYEIQDGIFRTSLFGPHIKNNLGVLLIQTDDQPLHPAEAKKQPVIHIGN